MPHDLAVIHRDKGDGESAPRPKAINDMRLGSIAMRRGPEGRRRDMADRGEIGRSLGPDVHHDDRGPAPYRSLLGGEKKSTASGVIQP